MEYNELKGYLEDGMSNKEIGEKVGLNPRTISYWVEKFNLKHLMINKPIEYKDENMFNKIDTPEKAYILGFILADGAIDGRAIELSVSLSDKEVLYYISQIIGGNVYEHNYINRETRRFPRARYRIGNKNILIDINKYGGKKHDRHLPIVRKDLKRYLLLGFFDGDGCITWGRRKDRDRVWQKVSFTSQYRMLEGVQNILIDEVGISSKIKPKGKEKCYCLNFSSKKDVLKFLDYIYPNDSFIVLHRKYEKANALRLELGEFREDPRTLSETI